MMIADFVKAMENKDYQGMARCFAEGCRLFDYCPAVMGRSNSFIYGPRAVDMFYHNKFILGGFYIKDPMIEDERTANFYASYGGPIVHVMVTIENYDPKTGLIKEMVIRPA